jgi:K+-sensing histidine kinase KdpD
VSDPNKTAQTRVTVVIDASRGSLDALKTAADIAARVQAHLMALFIEDINLFSLAELPFARELDRTSGTTRPLDRHAVTRALQADAKRIRQLLQTESEHRQITTSMKVVRGHYVSAAMEAAEETDVVILSHVTGVRLQTVKTPARKPARLATRAGGRRPAWTLFDGSPAAHRALAMAKDYSEQHDVGLVVLISSENAFKRLVGEAKDLLEGTQARYQPIAALDPREIARTMIAEGSCIFFLPRGKSSMFDKLPAFLLDELACPLVMVS